MFVGSSFSPFLKCLLEFLKIFLHGVYTAFKLAKETELEQSDPFAFFN